MIPSSILDLAEPAWKGKVSLAYPLFGTTATHAAVLFTYLGATKAKAYYEGLKKNGVMIVDGNATSRDVVVRGEVPIGFTDTDDANIALKQGKAVGVLFPDQRDDEMGALVIPNTVALVRNCPHPEEGKRLIDFLLSRETEAALAHRGSAQMPVRIDIPVPEGATSLSDIKMMAIDWEEVNENLTEVSSYLESVFVQ